MGRRLALLIATDEHEDSGLRRLTAPGADAQALAAVLGDPAIAGFEVTILVDEPHYRVGEAIADLYRDRRRDDLTLLYFTGHGLKDDDGRLYLAMSNTRRDSLLFTSLPAEQLDHSMEGCASQQKILILDCCYSGAFPAGPAAKADTEIHALQRFQGRGRSVLTASDSTQYSFEGDQLQGQARQSVFTYHLVAGLRDGSADLDGDGDITIDELYSYVHDRVVEEMPRQRPKKQTNVEGRTIIARNVNWALPGYLENALKSPIASDRLGALDALTHLHRVGNDLVRDQVAAHIEALAGDDSKAVSTAAAARLLTIRPEWAAPSPVKRPVVPAEQPLRAEPEAPKPAAQQGSASPLVSTPPAEEGASADPETSAWAASAAPVGPPAAGQTGLIGPPGGRSSSSPSPAVVTPDPSSRVPAQEPEGGADERLPRLSCAFLALAFLSWALLMDTADKHGVPPAVAWLTLGAAAAGLVSVLVERRRSRPWVLAVAASCVWCALYGTGFAIKNTLPDKTAGVYLFAAVTNLGVFLVNGNVLPGRVLRHLLDIRQKERNFPPRRRLFFLWSGTAASGFAITYFAAVGGHNYAGFDVLFLTVTIGTLITAAVSSRKQPPPNGSI